MTAINYIEQSPGYFVIEGALTFAQIDKKTVDTSRFIKAQGSICIDLKAVNAADSAGLALMIEWIKQCTNQGIKLSFKNIPSQILALAKLSGLDKNTYFEDTPA